MGCKMSQDFVIGLAGRGPGSARLCGSRTGSSLNSVSILNRRLAAIDAVDMWQQILSATMVGCPL